MQEDCDGFLYKEYLEKYRKTGYLTECDKETYTDLIHNKVSSLVPVAGEFPVIDTANSTEFGSRLTVQSMDAFSSMSEAEYSKWWGVNLNAVTKQPSEVETSLVRASGGIWNYGNLFSLADNSSQHYPIMTPFRCNYYFHLLVKAVLQCVFPVLELHVFGFPKDTCPSTILKIFRLFAPIYILEKKEDYALLYVSPEAGTMKSTTSIVAYSLIMALHAHVVNNYRIYFSFSTVCNKHKNQNNVAALAPNPLHRAHLFASSLQSTDGILSLHTQLHSKRLSFHTLIISLKKQLQSLIELLFCEIQIDVQHIYHKPLKPQQIMQQFVFFHAIHFDRQTFFSPEQHMTILQRICIHTNHQLPFY